MNVINNGNAAGGAVTVATMFDYLQPEINRPDMFQQRAYPIISGSGSSTAINSVQKYKTNNPEERSPFVSLFYTLGLIVVSASIFVSISAWSNVLLSWYDSMFVSTVVQPVTKSRLYFAITVTVISIVVIIILLILWYEYAIKRKI